VATVLLKPVGDRCNLACRYCFYHPGTGRPAGVMDEATLAAMTRAFLGEGESPTVFAWQGGEPTLAGRDFYQRALDLQRGFTREGQHVVNTFQTNGVLIDRDWARFLAEKSFLVGLSIDGPAEVHDAMRRTAGGGVSHSLAVRAWELLQERKVAVNILAVVSRASCDSAAEVYGYLTRELGADHLQFIPCVEWMPDGELADFSLRPGEYGRFLVALFDLWAGERERQISVKLFDDLVLFLAGKPMRDCMYRATCDSHLVVEQDGSVYPCDFFVADEQRLGSILEQALPELRSTPQASAFRSRKTDQRPAACAECRHFDICQAGCCKFWRPEGGGRFAQYLCEDMRHFLDQRRPHLEQMAAAIRARWQQWEERPAAG
jgi:uncharacterized protein